MIRKLGAIITQVMSYLTTLSAVAHVMRPHTETAWAITAGTALAVEIALIAMKETLFSGGAGVGWTGFIIDGLINAGGILPWASRLLTFAPIALILGLIAVDTTDPMVALLGGAVIGLILGFVLSIAPHRLWRTGKRAAAKTAER
jgi:hypothetical protein